MSTLAVIASSDLISNSRADINSNFAALNADKFEIANIDTDTALAADSDTKVASQKAIKAYVAAGGNVNASETAKGIVEEATDAETLAGTASGATGAKLVVTPAKLQTRLAVIRNGLTTKNMADASATQTIAHGLGRAPRRVRFTGSYSSAGPDSGSMTGVFDAGGQNCIGLMLDEGAGSASADASFTNATALKIPSSVGLTNYQVGTVSVDATNISIAWVKTGTPTGTWNILWEAE